MAISRLNGGGTDWSKYQPRQLVTSLANFNNASGEVTLLNVTGKGFFDWATIGHNGSSADNTTLRIYIDNTLIMTFTNSSYSGPRSSSILARKHQRMGATGGHYVPNYDGASYVSAYTGRVCQSFPFTDSFGVSGASGPTPVLLEDSIPFSNSLKITVSTSNTTNYALQCAAGYLLGN